MARPGPTTERRGRPGRVSGQRLTAKLIHVTSSPSPGRRGTRDDASGPPARCRLRIDRDRGEAASDRRWNEASAACLMHEGGKVHPHLAATILW